MKRSSVAGVVVAVALALLVVRTCGSAPESVPPTVSGADSRAGAARASAPGSRPRAAAPEPRPAVPEPVGPAPATSATERETGGVRPAASIPPRDDVPADAVLVDPATGLRAWVVVERVPRGLAGEAGTVPGRLELHLSAPVPAGRAFRVATEPESAARWPRGGLLRVEKGRDFGSTSFTGLAAGPATIVVSAAEPGESSDAVLRVPVVLRSNDEFPEPVLTVVPAAPDAETPGAVLAGERTVRGLAGSVAGRLRVVRSGFRGFATDATVVLVGADDPTGILGPLPVSVTIPAGATEAPEPIPIVLREKAGAATIRFRTGVQEGTVTVESVPGGWRAAPSFEMVVGATVAVPVALEPGTAIAALVEASGGGGVVRASVRAPARGPHPDRVVVDLTGLAAGDAVVRLRTPHRPDLELRVRVAESAEALDEMR